MSTISSKLCYTGRVRWDDPFGGTCRDTFCMSEDGQQLTQVTEMVMKTGTLCNYKYALGACQFLSAMMLCCRYHLLSDARYHVIVCAEGMCCKLTDKQQVAI